MHYVLAVAFHLIISFVTYISLILSGVSNLVTLAIIVFVAVPATNFVAVRSIKVDLLSYLRPW